MRCSRTFFSEKILRIDKYETQRMRLPHHQFNIKQLEFFLHTNNMYETVDGTKQWIHAMDKLQAQVESGSFIHFSTIEFR